MFTLSFQESIDTFEVVHTKPFSLSALNTKYVGAILGVSY